MRTPATWQTYTNLYWDDGLCNKVRQAHEARRTELGISSLDPGERIAIQTRVVRAAFDAESEEVKARVLQSREGGAKKKKRGIHQNDSDDIKE